MITFFRTRALTNVWIIIELVLGPRKVLNYKFKRETIKRQEEGREKRCSYRGRKEKGKRGSGRKTSLCSESV